MIAPEVTARMRRLFYAEHWPVGTIATALGVHHRRSRALNREQLVGAVMRASRSVLDPYKPFIADVLERHPRLRATRLHAMLHDRGYPGGVLAIRRYVRAVRPRRAEAYLRLQTLPGEQGQVDWGHFGKIPVGHARRPLVCFVLVLSWSRAVYARFALDQSLESFLRGHVEAFNAIGAVPRTLLYDNLKSVVLERMGDHVRYHPRLLELAGHYHFAPKPCAPYRGNEKGKVERTIQYLRHAFFEARRFSDVTDLNRQLAEWIAETAHHRRAGRSGETDRRMRSPGTPRLLALTASLRASSSARSPPERHRRPLRQQRLPIPHETVGRPLALVADERRSDRRWNDGAGAARPLVRSPPGRRRPHAPRRTRGRETGRSRAARARSAPQPLPPRG
jgi:transposase